MELGTYMESELDKVKGKTEAQIEGRRKLKLRQMLRDGPRGFAEIPVPPPT